MIVKGSSVPIQKNLKTYLISVYILIFLIIFSFFFFAVPAKIYCDPDTAIYNDRINISAKAAVVVNYDTGDILWEKNSSALLYPASITKILSSIVAIEKIDNMEEITKISRNASGRNHSAFKFKTGDSMTLLDLLKASLICSHNNAIIALAEYVSGNVEDFVELMNMKAEEIGAENTYFQNVNGLDDNFPYHKTTAADIAKIASYCMKNELFSKIVDTREDVIRKNKEEIKITNTNTLLSHDYIKGIKTGYTINAGFCLVIYSEKENLRLITVTMDSASLEERDKDTLKLLDWAYNNLEYVKIVDSKQPVLTVNTGGQTIADMDLYPDRDFITLININSDVVNVENKVKTDIALPVSENEVMGTMEVIVDDKKIEEIDLIVRESISNAFIYEELSTKKEVETIYILIFLLVFYFLTFTIIIVRNLLLKRNI
ncbi:MAG: D-alanyl-D-alanine carboxypeptidase [Actinomycetota bacterium]|nr:D-alanyl-D-alanine carboxypeptidase [Actinomycetota bacterium]